MTGTLFVSPKFVPVTNTGVPRGGATLTFTQAGTNVNAPVYTTADLSVAHPVPVSATSAGVFPAIYLDPSAGYDYKIVLKSSSGAQIWSEDNVPPTPRGPVWCGTATGTADAIVLTPAKPIKAYSSGLVLQFVSSAANTGAVTVAVSGLAAKSVTKNGAAALVAGDIPSGALVTITYDGTRFQLPPPPMAGYVAADFAKLASANYFTAGQFESTATLTYGTSVAVGDPATRNHCLLTITDGSAFTIENPTTDAAYAGHRLELTLRNTSGGAVGAITWGNKYRMSAWTSPANGFSRSIAFRCDGTLWAQVSQTGADIPNFYSGSGAGVVLLASPTVAGSATVIPI